jgi:hypothetical protein
LFVLCLSAVGGQRQNTIQFQDQATGRGDADGRFQQLGLSADCDLKIGRRLIDAAHDSMGSQVCSCQAGITNVDRESKSFEKLSVAGLFAKLAE